MLYDDRQRINAAENFDVLFATTSADLVHYL